MKQLSEVGTAWRSEEAAELYISPLGAGDLVDVFNYIGPFHQVYVLTHQQLSDLIREREEAAQIPIALCKLALLAIAHDENYRCACGEDPYVNGEDCPKCFALSTLINNSMFNYTLETYQDYLKAQQNDESKGEL